MSAVHPDLIRLIEELQSLSSLSEFSLAGGTNLALRYNHRKSIDIDLIVPSIIGKPAFQNIIDEVKVHFDAKNVKIQLHNEKLGEQYIFLRMFITYRSLTAKVELLQNMICLFPIETHNGIRIVSKSDIGLFKMMSASNRLANKDIYDLVYITEEIPLIDLYEQLKIKTEKFGEESHKTIFDLDGEVSPIYKPELLLEFDTPKPSKSNKPFHSHDKIDIEGGAKTWIEARLAWRSNVRKLFEYLGKEFPGPKGIDI